METERQDRERESTTQTSIVTFTFWLVIVGGLQAVAIIFGLVWTKRAADAAKKTAIVAIEALHLTERADVLFETQKYLDTQTGLYSGEINPTTEVVFVERNYGRTRAKDLQIGWCMYVEGDPVPEIVLLPPLVLGPGALLETRIGMTIGHSMTRP